MTHDAVPVTSNAGAGARVCPRLRTMSGLWYSDPLPGHGGTARRLRRGAGLALVFAGVLATGAATGAWGDGTRTLAGSPPGAAGHPSAGRHGGGSAAGDGAGAARKSRDADELVSRSGDRWSSAYTAGGYQGLRRSLEGEYVGVGVSVRAAPRGARPGHHSAHLSHSAGSPHAARGGPGVLVTRVRGGSPAARAGVRAGDRLRTIDGVPVAGRPVTDVVSRLRGTADGATGAREGASPRAGGTDGGRGSTVVLGLGRGGRHWTRTVHRTRLHSDAVSVASLPGGATRIGVSSFTEGSGAQVRDAVARVPRGSGVVLDLRGNSGGLVSEAAAAASAFLDGGLVATYDEHGSQRALYAGHGRHPGPDSERPLVVLVDGGTMSAAELLTGALQDRGRAVVVGSRTFGKGSVQVPRRLPDGSVAELTVGHYSTPSGRTLDGEGITPDLAVTAPGESIKRARTVLSGLEPRA